MQRNNKKVIKNYFSDYITWLIFTTSLMIVSFTAALIFNASNRFIWVIPAVLGIMYMLSLPLLILYIKVRKDMQKHSVEKAVFRISDLQIDEKYNFKNRGGAIVGKVKYRISDEENNRYLLCASDERKPELVFSSTPDFFVEIEYLEISKLVLSMKIHENHSTLKDARKQSRNINLFKQTFNNYF